MSQKDDGGPAFPTWIEWGTEGGVGFLGEPCGEPGTKTFYSGMPLRAYFAVHAPVQRTDFTDYGAAAIVGREMPDYPGDEASEQARADYQIATAQFRIDLDVALRLRWADAMLKARES